MTEEEGEAADGVGSGARGTAATRTRPALGAEWRRNDGMVSTVSQVRVPHACGAWAACAVLGQEAGCVGGCLGRRRIGARALTAGARQHGPTKRFALRCHEAAAPTAAAGHAAGVGAHVQAEEGGGAGGGGGDGGCVQGAQESESGAGSGVHAVDDDDKDEAGTGAQQRPLASGVVGGGEEQGGSVGGRAVGRAGRVGCFAAREVKIHEYKMHVAQKMRKGFVAWRQQDKRLCGHLEFGCWHHLGCFEGFDHLACIGWTHLLDSTAFQGADASLFWDAAEWFKDLVALLGAQSRARRVGFGHATCKSLPGGGEEGDQDCS
jgi:hypothetical protein